MCIGRIFATCCRYMLMLILVTGMILSILAVSSCDFMKAVYEVPNSVLGGNSSTSSSSASSSTVTMDAALGLWRYEKGTDGCTAYNLQQQQGFTHDRNEIVAQKCGVIAPILAFVAFFFVCLEMKLCCIPCLKFVVALLLTATELCQGLTFLLFNSHQFCDGNMATSILKHHCVISKGGNYSASALALYVLASALLSCMPSMSSGTSAKSASDKDSSSSMDTAASGASDENNDMEQPKPKGTLA